MSHLKAISPSKAQRAARHSFPSGPLWSSVKAIVSEDPGPHARVSPKQSPHLTKNATERNSLRKLGGSATWRDRVLVTSLATGNLTFRFFCTDRASRASQPLIESNQGEHIYRIENRNLTLEAQHLTANSLLDCLLTQDFELYNILLLCWHNKQLLSLFCLTKATPLRVKIRACFIECKRIEWKITTMKME